MPRQQRCGSLGAGLAAAGLIVTQAADGMLVHFDVVGYVLVATTTLTLWMMYRISRSIEGAAAPRAATPDRTVPERSTADRAALDRAPISEGAGPPTS